MSTTYAPIVLFTYNRPEHTQGTVTALAQNDGAAESDLIIYSDGPKNDAAKEAVAAVRTFLKTVAGFKSVTVIERDRNWGLADSIVDGVTSTINQYGSVIVLEDDIVTAPTFLSFMNQALALYEHDESVMHVSGYFFPLSAPDASTLPPTFFYNQTSCWGWGTWKRAWQHYQADAETLLQNIVTSGRLREFNMDGAFRFSSTLRANAEGRQRTWAIKWHASVFLQHGLCLHPRYSLTENSGHDGSGTHSERASHYQNRHFPPPGPVILKRQELVESKSARRLAARFLTRLRPTLRHRLTQFVRRFFHL